MLTIYSMNIYKYDTYKSIIKLKIDALRKDSVKSISLGTLAKTCGIQKTYISKVLNHDGHFNSDQLYSIGNALKFTTKEISYLFLLLEYEKSEHPKRRDFLKKKIDKVKSQYLKSENYLTDKELPQNSLTLKYHLNPNALLVHMYLTIPKYRLNTDSIAQKIKVTKNEFLNILDLLQDLKYISYKDNKIEVLKENIHLSKDSELYPFYKTLIKVKTIEKIQNDSVSSDYNFSVIFSSSEKAKQEVQEHFMNFLKTIEEIVKKSKCEEVYQVNFDLISW